MMHKDEPTTKNNKASQTNKVVILGSGYGGIHACHTLAQQAKPDDQLEILLLSDVDHLMYQTMIYEIPAGNLAPSAIRQSVRTMLQNNNVSFRRCVATEIDPEDNAVTYKLPHANTDGSEAAMQTDHFDYLVSAIGSETCFYDTPGAREHAYPLKRLEQAKKLKNTLLSNLEKAEQAEDEELMDELLSVVVVGGGPTGVTLTAKIANLFNNELASAFPELAEKMSITVIEANDHLIKRAGVWFSENVTKTLHEINRVQVLTNKQVNEVTADGVSYGQDEFLLSQCVIWTAGVTAREIGFPENAGVQIDEKSKRVHVTPQLHLPEYENIFVAGDQAWVQRIDSDQPYPMRAQFAVRQGQLAGENILTDVRGESMDAFDWKDKGLVVSVGHGHTFARILGFKVSGFIATMAYKSVYLMSTIGIRAKVRATMEWVMNLFLPRDISEL